MASGPELTHKEGGSMIELIKHLAPFVGVIVATVAGWWAWKTSYVKALSDRVTQLEGRFDAQTKEHGAALARIAELTAENLTLRAQLTDSREREAKWQARWAARRQRQTSNPGLEEDTSDADALDDYEADRSDGSGLRPLPRLPPPPQEPP